MANPAIRVLLVEDNPTDALLLQAGLETDRLNIFVLTNVERLDQVKALLEREPFDVILLDLGLPDSQGLDTFERCRHIAPDLPIIVSSGNTDEQAAIDAVRAGAQDYLVKGQVAWEMAARTIRHAMERHKLAQSLQESEKRFRALIENSADAIVLVDARGNILYESPALTRITGFDLWERMGRSGFENLYPDDRSAVLAKFAEVLGNPGETIHAAYRSVRKDGNVWWAELTATNLLNEPSVQGIVVNFRDVTERKQAEIALQQSEERHRQISSMISDYVYSGLILPAGAARTEWVSGAFEKITGYTREEIEQLPAGFSSLVLPEDLVMIMAQQPALLESGSQTAEYRIRRKDGQVCWMRDYMQLVPAQPGEGAIRIIGAVQDITERKLAEEALRQSEARFSKVFQVSPVGINIFRLSDNCSVDANQAFLDLVGYSRAELVGHSAAELNIFVEQEQRQAWHRTLLSGQPVRNQDAKIRCKTGEIRDILASIDVIEVNNEKMGLVIATDITERKRNEKLLKQWADAFENCAQGLAIGLPDTNQVLTCNSSFARLQGRTVDEIASMPILRFYPPEEHEYVKQAIAKSDLTGRNSFEAHMIRKDGGRYPVQMDLVSVRDEAGNLMYRVATQQDITERKLAEEKIRFHQALLEETGHIAKVGGWSFDALTGEGFWTEEVARIHDLDPALSVSKEIGLSYYTDESRPLIESAIEACIKRGASYDLELELISAKGIRKWIHTIGHPEMEAGRVMRVFGSFQDITDRKRAEEQIRELQEFTSATIDALSAHICVLDEYGTIISVNRAWREFADANPPVPLNHYLGVNYLAVCDNARGEDGAEAAPIAENLRAILSGRISHFQLEYPCHAPHEKRWFVLRVTSFTQNGLMRIAIAHENITERKQAEEALRESETRLTTMFHTSPLPIVISRLKDGRYTECNRAFEKLTGYSKPEIIGKTAQELGNWVDLERRQQLVLELRSQGLVENFEFQLKSMDGQLHDLLMSAELVDLDGETHVLTIAQDITDRKQVELALQKSERVLRLFVEHSPASIAMFDRDMHYIVASNRYLQDYRLGEQDLTGHSLYEIFPETPERWKEIYRRCLAGAIERADEDPFVRADGSLDWVHWEMHPWYEAADQVGGVILFSEVITERKEAEREILHYSEQLATVAEIESALVASLDQGSIYDVLSSGIQRLFRDVTAVYISNFEAERGLIKAVYGIHEGQILDISTLPEIPLAPEGHGTQSRVIHTRQPLIIGSHLKDKLRAGTVTRVGSFENGQETQSALYVPMLAQGAVQGLIQLQSLVPGRFDEEDARVLSLVANAAAAAIQNARLYEIAQKELGERRAAEIKLRKSEEQYRYLFENNPHPMWAYDLQTLAFLAVNDAAIDKYGYSREEFLGMTIADIRPEEDVQRLIDDVAQKRPALQHSGGWRHKFKDGTVIDVEISSHTLELENHHSALVVALDVTERKQAEEALKRSEEHLRLTLETTSEGFWVVDTKRKFAEVNPAYCAMSGYMREELLNMHIQDLEVIENGEEIDAHIQKVMRLGSDRFETIHRRKDGSLFGVEVNVNVLDAANGLLICFISDITDRKKSEDALRVSQARYLDLFENSPISLWEEDFSRVKAYFDELRASGVDDFVAYFDSYPETVQKCSSLVNVLDVNYATLSLMEAKSKGELLGILAHTLNPEEIATFKWELLSLARGELHFEGEEIIRTFTGVARDVLIHISVAPGFEDTLGKVIVSILDITERKQIERELRESEARFRLIAETIDEVFWMADPALNTMLYVSPGYERVWGRPLKSLYDDPISFTQSILPDERGNVFDLLTLQKNGMPFDLEYHIRHSDGSIRTIWDRGYPVMDESGKVVRYVGVAQDITERKQIEDERQELIIALSARTAELSLLLEAGHALSETLDRTQIYAIIYRYLKAAMPCDMLVVSSFDPKTELISCEYLHTAAGLQDVSGFPPIHIEPPGKGTQSRVIHSGESLLLPDYMDVLKTAQTSYIFNDKAEIVEPPPDDEGIERTRSAIIVPLKVDGKVVGAMQIFSYQLKAHTEDHLRFVEALAFHISASLSNARLFGELEQRVQERTAEIETIRQRLELATKAAELGIWDWNTQTGELLWDEQMSRNYGIKHGDFRGTLESFMSFAHPDDVAKLMDFAQEAIKGVSHNQADYRVIRGDNSTGYIKAQGIVLRDSDGQPQHVIGVTQNITQEKLAELALRESEEQNRLLFEETPDAVILFDGSGRVKRMNHAFELLTGIPKTDFIGYSMAEMGLLSEEDAEKLRQAKYQALQLSNDFASTEIKLLRDDGSIHDLSVRIFALNIQGQQHYLNTMRDITSEKKAEDALRFANAEMVRALRLKDEFLANMSHELRTPLNAILGISESLEEQVVGPLNEKQQHYIRTVSESGRHLLALINDILDLSKIEAGRMELNIREINAELLVQSSLRMVKELAQKKNQSMTFTLDEHVKTVEGDERRIKQVLVNLLSNAVKFTPVGGKIGLEISGDMQAEEVTLTVWDTGIGIDPEDIPRLFQPFTQLDSGLNREHSGTGLGLALVSEIIHLHGGHVGVQSKPGEGSRFFIVLPWKSSERAMAKAKQTAINVPTQPLAPTVHAKRGKILLVEDTESIILFVNDYLTALGYKVIVARDGLAGVEEAKAHHPDLILMDIQMPGMDGFNATRMIREAPELAKTPIIALTAMAMPGDRERCLEAGMQDYLSKPISLKELTKIIHDYLLISRRKSK